MSQFQESVRKQLGYLLSLPERTLRSLSALVGGASLLVSETLLPVALRESTFYRILIGDTQRYLVEQVAQVARDLPETAESDTVTADYAQRKLTGAVLETVGLLSVQFSPLWVFAIVGDAAAGSKLFLNRLVGQLKKNGVIPPDAHITELVDVLNVMQTASEKSATVIDTPPLSRADLAKLVNDLKTSYQQMFAKTADLLPRLETVWGQLEQVASQQNISLERLQGILTIEAAEWGRKGVGTAVAITETSTELLGEAILSSYANTLEQVKEQGIAGYVGRYMKPFWETAVSHFQPHTKTWTEEKLSAK